MGIFYTGKGDRGKSHVQNKKIDKTSPEIEALGDLDELNSLLGLIRSFKISGEIRKHLKQIQEDLFIVQANVARFFFDETQKIPDFPESKVRFLERVINDIEIKVKPGRGFIVSGEDSNSAWLDYARSVSRRTERNVLKINKIGFEAEVKSYMNRLSSFLFALARLNSYKLKKKEFHPSYK